MREISVDFDILVLYPMIFFEPQKTQRLSPKGKRLVASTKSSGRVIL